MPTHHSKEDTTMDSCKVAEGSFHTEAGIEVQSEDATIRVHVSLLDSLMTLAGELVLSRNQLLQGIGTGDLRSIDIVGQRIDQITSELQGAIMLTRMQPIGNVFARFPEFVAELAESAGKEVELKVSGKEVELDRTLMEAVNEPLTQLVRNGVEHGIEQSAVRKESGKAPRGLLALKAYHEAGQVVIEVRDDGRGFEPNDLVTLAREKGVISGEQSASLSDKEKMNLIMLPGFSTAGSEAEGTDKSSGMSRVRGNLDKLGGNINITSEPGVGTTVAIKLPLTLAIIPSQIILVGGERYAIPQANLEELVRIPAAQVKERVEYVGNAEVVRLRGDLLPLVNMAQLLGIERIYTNEDGVECIERRKRIADRRSRVLTPLGELLDSNNEKQSGSGAQFSERAVQDRRVSENSALNIVVVTTGHMKYGLVVDEFQDSEEIVIKPLGRHLQNCKGYAGATIMGDGRVALILDLANLAKMASLRRTVESTRAAQVSSEKIVSSRDSADTQSFLIFRSAETEQYAIPLDQVERIEKIKRSHIEFLGGKRVMQYRGGSMTLISVDDVASVQPLADREDLLVIVFQVEDTQFGLLGIGPVDTINGSGTIDDTTLKQIGISGSAIINGQTTMMADVEGMLRGRFPEMVETI